MVVNVKNAIVMNLANVDVIAKNANATNAVVRKTGIFLYENGNVGTVQHVDMAAYAQKA